MDIAKQIKALNQQLYPTGRAWGYIHGSEQVDTVISKFVDGLDNPFIDGPGNYFVSIYGSEASPSKRLTNAFLKSYERLYESIFALTNQILADNDNFDATDAANWERVFGLNSEGLTLDERKTNILRKQGYPNGVAERGNYVFIQQQLRLSGFDVYVHENRFSDGGSGWLTVNPDAIGGKVEDATNTGNVKETTAQDTSGRNPQFKDDGLKMYVLGIDNDTIYQYTLTTPFDVSTATYDSISYSVNAQAVIPLKFRFKDDGLNFYVLDSTTKSIYQYDLSIAWDLSTSSYSGISILLTEITPNDFQFKGDGLKLYILDSNNNTIYQYSLSVAFDLSTKVSDGLSFDFSYLTVIFRSFSFDSTGGSIYLGGTISSIRQYYLSTAWKIDTSVFKSSLSLGLDGVNPINADGIYLDYDRKYIIFLHYINSIPTTKIYQYNNPEGIITRCANYIDQTIDDLYIEYQPTQVVESGVYESGEAESGRSIAPEIDERFRAMFFVGGETFPNAANVPLARKEELRELILKLKPLQTVGQLIINYT